MAKATGLTGNFKGKVGNIVGYQLKNSNNKVTLGVRTYVAEVSNPKTELQAIQRMKMAPAINFYRQLQEILDNAWQGTKYGTKSRQYFMSLAMKQSTGIPFLVKGDKKFYPGEYPVAVGSINGVAVTEIIGSVIGTSLLCDGSPSNFGDFSQKLITGNLNLRNGDKITVIVCGKNTLGEYVPFYFSFNLDKDSTAAMNDIIPSAVLSMQVSQGKLSISVTSSEIASVAAAAVIVSRLDTTGVTPQWQRSNATMFCSDAYKADMMGAEKYAAAIASYMASGNYSSDWYLNIGLTGSTPTTDSGGDDNGGGDEPPIVNP